METQLLHVKLTDIAVSKTNKMFRSEAELSADALSELTASIKTDGVISPVLLRPNGQAGKYELVAGERRYRAAKFVQTALKDRDTIPAYIRPLSDKEALDLQITENLQRKDVHPLKEAAGYQMLLDKKDAKNTRADLALRFGKSETYILQRLKLNSLNEQAKKDFAAGDMTLAQALVIARLNPDDQAKVVKQCSNKAGGKKYYESVAQLEDFIYDNITHDLSKAPFDVKDASLVPKAGACSTCHKRSGAQSKLFADVEEQDRCFDPSCFKLKKMIGVRVQFKKLIEDKPDTVFIESRYWNAEKIDPVIAKMLKDNGISILHESKYETYSSNDHHKPTQAVIVNHEPGKKETIYIKGQAKSTGEKSSKPKPADMSAEDRKEAVARIRERSKRNVELDQEKIYGRILEALKKSKALTVYSPGAVIDKLINRWIILQHAGFDRHYLQGFNINGSPQEQIKKILKFSDAEFAIMTRKLLIKEYAGGRGVGGEPDTRHVHDTEGVITWRLAESLSDVPVKQFVAEQKEIAQAREARAAERIKQLSASQKKSGSKVAPKKKK